jgi:hypothetical protein
MKTHGPPDVGTICELGGANSCFYPRLRALFTDANYVVLDSNDYGLRLLKERNSHDTRLELHNRDLRDGADGLPAGDIVFSVGLIEHFETLQTAEIIRSHFAMAKPNGLVIITFPTPTWLYRITRYLAETLGVWRFPDERPLRFEEVTAEVERHGTVVASLINWPIILTQGVVAVRRRL